MKKRFNKKLTQKQLRESSYDFKYLTPAERDIFRGLDTKRAKKLEEDGIRKAVAVVLGQESDLALEDGSKVTVTNIERLAVRTFEEAMKNPSTSKLKDLSHIMGEDKITVEAKVESGSDIFLGIVKDSDTAKDVIKVLDDSRS